MRDLVKVDDEFTYLLNNMFISTRGYAKVKTTEGWIPLHKYIMGSKDGYEIDHINRDKLDNRRSNLRFVTHQVNLRNRKGWGKLPKGVYFDKTINRRKPYKVMRRVDGKTVSLGYYRTVEEAEKVSTSWEV